MIVMAFENPHKIARDSNTGRLLWWADLCFNIIYIIEMGLKVRGAQPWQLRSRVCAHVV